MVIVRKGYGIQDADVEISTVTKTLEMWGIDYTYTVVEEPKDIFIITFTLCDPKKSED